MLQHKRVRQACHGECGRTEYNDRGKRERDTTAKEAGSEPFGKDDSAASVLPNRMDMHIENVAVNFDAKNLKKAMKYVAKQLTRAKIAINRRMYNSLSNCEVKKEIEVYKLHKTRINYSMVNSWPLRFVLHALTIQLQTPSDRSCLRLWLSVCHRMGTEVQIAWARAKYRFAYSVIGRSRKGSTDPERTNAPSNL